MRVDKLTNEELARVLAEYLKLQQKEYTEINKIHKDLFLLNNEITDINLKYDYKINKLKDYEGKNDYLDVDYDTLRIISKKLS